MVEHWVWRRFPRLSWMRWNRPCKNVRCVHSHRASATTDTNKLTKECDEDPYRQVFHRTAPVDLADLSPSLQASSYCKCRCSGTRARWESEPSLIIHPKSKTSHPLNADQIVHNVVSSRPERREYVGRRMDADTSVTKACFSPFLTLPHSIFQSIFQKIESTQKKLLKQYGVFTIIINWTRQ